MIVKTAFICITIIIKIASIKKIIDYHFKFRGSKTLQFLKTGPIRKQGVWLYKRSPDIDLSSFVITILTELFVLTISHFGLTSVSWIS